MTVQEPRTLEPTTQTPATPARTTLETNAQPSTLDHEPTTLDQLTTLDRVQDQIRADDKGKWDIVLPRSETLLQNGKLLFPDCKAYECESGLFLSPWATGQICSRLNIPTAYFKRCPDQLQDAQYNYWNARHGDVRRTSQPKNERAGIENNALNGNTSNSAYPDENGYRFHDEKFNREKFNDGSSPHNGNFHKADFYEEPFEADTSIENGYDPSEPDAYLHGFSHHSGSGHRFKNGLYAGTQNSEYWLLRARHNTLRAALTDRYTPLDNRTLLDSLHRTLPSHLQVQWLSLDDEAFHLRIIDPSLCYSVLEGDPLMAGIHIANSEVGQRSVTVDALVFRQVCSNGLIRLVKGKSILCQRHVAVSPPHFVALLRQSFQTAFATVNGFIEQMTRATRTPLRDVESEMKSLATHWHLSQSFLEQVKASLSKERSDQQETVYGLTNALTAAAQTLDAGARYEMEVLAGKLLEKRSLQSEKATAGARAAAINKAENTATDAADAIDAVEVLFEAQAVPSSQTVGTSLENANSEVRPT